MIFTLGDHRLPQRFWSKVRVDQRGCWVWVASMDRDGYGKFYPGYDQGIWRAYRVAYSTLVGPIPPGLQIDHLCRNRACVNPEHLEPVTPAENARRSAPATKTRCVHGHAFTPENTYLRPAGNGGRRDCRACIRDRARRYKQKRSAA